MSTVSKWKNTIYIDLLKLLAAFLVIFNHLPGYTLYYVSDGVKQWGYMAATMITRANVPLFLLISGALLLGRQESYKDLYIKRILRYIVVIILANTLIYTMWHSANFDLQTLVLGILRGTIQGSYWYLYAYLGFLIMLPFLRKIAASFTKKDFIYLLIWHFVANSLLSIIAFVAAHYYGIPVALSTNFQIPMFVERTVFYPLAGYYLANVANVENWSLKRIAITALAGITGIFISMYITYVHGTAYGWSQNYVQLFDYLTAIALFILARYMFGKLKLSERALQTIHTFATVTFGIYLFDPVIKKYLYTPVEAFLEPYLPTILVSLAWCVISMIICGVITYLLKKIKVVNKFL